MLELRTGPGEKLGRAVSGAFRITRPLNSAAAGFVALAGAHAPGAPLAALARYLPACLVAVLLTAAGNVVNDYFDLETDRINKQHRPLPSGDISPMLAVLLAASLYLSVGVRGWALAPTGRVVILSVAVFSILYSVWLKRTVLVGNCVVSFLSALTVAWGPLALGESVGSRISAAVVVFFFILAREVLKMVEDSEADRQTGVTTLVTVIGRQSGLRLFVILAGVTLVLSVASYPLGGYSVTYLIVLLCSLDLAILYALHLIICSDTAETIGRALRVTKMAFLAGAVALFLR